MAYTDFLRYEGATPQPDLEIAAGYVQHVLRVSYTRLFEVETTLPPTLPLPAGTIRELLFDEEDAGRVAKQQERMQQYLEDEGSVYYISRRRRVPLSLVKISPSYSGKVNKILNRSPNCYINDVASAYPHMGETRRLLDGALSNFSPRSRVELDAFAIGNTVANNWFRRLGFNLADKQPNDHHFTLGYVEDIGKTVVIPQIRMEASSVGSVRDKLRKNT